jgi:hypothetical protein
MEGKMYQLNNPVTFNEKPMGSEEFLNRMVEALGLLWIDVPKEEFVKRDVKP